MPTPIPRCLEIEANPVRKSYLEDRFETLSNSLTDNDPRAGERVIVRMRIDGFETEADDFLDWIAARVISKVALTLVSVTLGWPMRRCATGCFVCQDLP